MGGAGRQSPRQHGQLCNHHDNQGLFKISVKVSFKKISWNETTYPLTFKIIFKCCALTHWGRVTHICVGKLTIIGSDNGLSPGRRQTIFWTNARILLIGPLGTTFSETSTRIQAFSFKKMHLKMSSAKWRLFRLGLNVLTQKCSPVLYNAVVFGIKYNMLNYYLISSLKAISIFKHQSNSWRGDSIHQSVN